MERPEQDVPGDPMSDHKDRYLVAALAAVAFGMAALMALGSLQGIAHVSDEVAYTMQAKLFAAGMRTGPPAGEPSLVRYPYWQTTPRSFAVFPPGWPALLALGVALGVPWLVNALLAAALPPLSWLLARAWDRPVAEARLAALVAALSPGIVLLSGSRMSHTSVLVALLAALVVIERRNERPLLWIAAACGLAYVVLARQLDALLLGGPLLAWGLLRLRRRPVLAATWIVLPAAAAALILADNLALTGDPLEFPVTQWYDAWVAEVGRPPGCNALGFGEDHGCHPTLGSWGHSPAKALAIAADTTVLLDRFLLGLPGGLLVALCGLIRARRFTVPILATLLVFGGYALYWSPGNVYGARFWHPLYAFLPVLVAAGLDGLPRRLRSWLPVVVLVLGAAVGLGRAAVELRDGYWCIDRSLPQLLDEQGIDDGVILLVGRGTARASWPWLGCPELRCDPLLASGGLLQLSDPSRTSGGLQVRRILTDDSLCDELLDRDQPDTPVWLLEHDLATGRAGIHRLR